jgi:hypothetical protein
MFGKPMTLRIFRDGTAALIENKTDQVIRSYYDLAKRRSFSWDTADASPVCGSGTFGGDWGDPFSQDLITQLNQLHPKAVGSEVVNGIKTNVLEAINPQDGSKHRVWLDASYGALIKWTSTGADGKAQTQVEVTSLVVGKPPASTFALPADCAKAAATPLPPTEEEQVAAITGSAVGKYVKAGVGPGSKDSCSVQLSIVHSKSLAPITRPFRIAVDPSVDADHPSPHVMGEAGKPFFQGGGLHEVTDRVKSARLQLDGLSPFFDVELVFTDNVNGKGPSAASAQIYKQCFGKSTSKLFLVLNPDDNSDPNAWVWEKP